jgi:hypothetical protein
VKRRYSFRQQLHRNLIAIFSLVFAVIGLTYNTWRNELTEDNRNIRAAAFEILVLLGDLQRVVFFGHYDRNDVIGNPRNGWAYVLTISDLSEIMPDPLPTCTATLEEVWSASWQLLGKDEKGALRIGSAIENCRTLTLEALQNLR